MSRILTLDIETAPHEVYAWGMWQQNVAVKQIISPTYMLSWAAKFVDSREVAFRTCFDADVLDKLSTIMAAADIIVTYNGNKFDLKHIQRELILAGEGPPRPFSSVDLLPIVRKNFNFPHNRLDYVCSELLGERKLDTGGFDLWPAFMQGDAKALKLMQRYNIRDVRLTEKLYKTLRPWIKNHPYVSSIPDAFDDSAKDYTCPACGSHKVRLDRPRRTRCYAVRIVNCEHCGHWFDGQRKKLC